MQKEEQTSTKRLRITVTVYKIMAYFVFVYGLISVLFYLFALLSPVFSDISPVFLGYSSFSKSAFVFLMILFLFMYMTVFIDGILLIKLSAYAVTIYFFVLIVYYSINIWVTGSIDFISLSIEVLYGMILSYLKKKIIRNTKEK